MQIFSFDKTPGRVACINGEAYLFFSGYAYLGMQYVPEFEALIKEGMDKYGWLFPSSRISNTRLNIYEEAEALLSAITGMEETLLLSNGFTAGRIATAPHAGNIINLHPSHPAIQRKNITGNSNVYAADSVETINAAITDFVFVQNNYKVQALIIDDSHGMGLIGENGEGITSRLPRQCDTEYILTYSLAKAFNIIAGAVSCSKEKAKIYRRLHAYTSATAPSPAMLYAFIHGQHLYAQQRLRLRKNMQYFQMRIKNINGIFYHAELPVFVLPENVHAQEFYSKKIIISSFAYPDAGGKKYNRIVLSALHTEEDMEILAGVLESLVMGG